VDPLQPRPFDAKFPRDVIEEEDRVADDERNPVDAVRALRRDPQAGQNQEPSEIERVLRVSVRTGDGETHRLLQVAGGPQADRFADRGDARARHDEPLRRSRYEDERDDEQEQGDEAQTAEQDASFGQGGSPGARAS